jgi:hypothetical protein
MNEREAKVAGNLLENWGELVRLLFEFREKWAKHLELVQIMNIDYVDSRLQGYLSHGFNRAEFYLALPDLVEYARAQGGIEYLQIGKEKKENGRGTERPKEGPKSYGRK